MRQLLALLALLAVIVIMPSCSTGLTDLTVSGDQTIGGTLGVTGATTLSGALAVTGVVNGLTKFETKTDDYSVTAPDDCGGTFVVSTNDKAIVLPDAAAGNLGCVITMIDGGADATVQVSFSPHASDSIIGSIAVDSAIFSSSAAAGKGLVNTKGTALQGDWVSAISDGSTNWYIIGGVGIWANNS